MGSQDLRRRQLLVFQVKASTKITGDAAERTMRTMTTRSRHRHTQFDSLFSSPFPLLCSRPLHEASSEALSIMKTDLCVQLCRRTYKASDMTLSADRTRQM